MTAASTTRERIVEAAVAMTTEAGWSGVTMAALADRVGVSRQTVYNEVGSKEGLAEAVILRELARFLAVVSAAFDRHPPSGRAGSIARRRDRPGPRRAEGHGPACLSRRTRCRRAGVRNGG